jgi:hypothetical protein
MSSVNIGCIVMLERAFNHASMLSKEVAQAIDDPYFDYLWQDFTNFTLDIQNNNFYKQQWVSVENDWKIVGYFEAEIDRSARYVTSLIVANFAKKGNITFSLDLKEFFKRLIYRYNYSKIVFSVVTNSPNEKLYDKFISRYGGRVVGIFKNHKILQDGTLRDMKYYEVLNEELKSRIKEMHPNENV